MVEITVDSESRAANTCFRVARDCLNLAHQASEEWEINHHCTNGNACLKFPKII